MPLLQSALCQQRTCVCSSINHETPDHNYNCLPDNELVNYWRSSFIESHSAAVPAHLFLSKKITSPWSEAGALICRPPWSRNNSSSMSSVASRRYWVSLLSRSGTPHGRCLLGLSQGTCATLSSSWTARRFLTSLKARRSLAFVASYADKHSVKCLVAGVCSISFDRLAPSFILSRYVRVLRPRPGSHHAVRHCPLAHVRHWP